MTSIEKAIDRFLSLNELGKTDSKNLNKLVRLLEDGKVETERAVQEIYADAKNPGGSFRNFLRRVREAIKTAAGNQEDRRLEGYAGIPKDNHPSENRFQSRMHKH